MSNRLKMADIQAIIALHKKGWRNRRIARELGINRETVAKYIRAGTCAAKPAKAPIGSKIMEDERQEGGGSVFSDEDFREENRLEASRSSPLSVETAGDPKPAKAPIGSEAVFRDIEPVEVALGSEAPVGVSALSVFLGKGVR
jgi:hypothetical protein